MHDDAVSVDDFRAQNYVVFSPSIQSIESNRDSISNMLLKGYVQTHKISLGQSVRISWTLFMFAWRKHFLKLAHVRTFRAAAHRQSDIVDSMRPY